MSLFSDYAVLLYYHYIPIEKPEEICNWQQQLSTRLDLKGRIRVSPEGLNGTLGNVLNTSCYYVVTTFVFSDQVGPLRQSRFI